ncbi:MAG: VOC family protein [Gammaproteobacteria bacterium]|nr:VOC family protein [Gammaproteobacteria bacterium]
MPLQWSHAVLYVADLPLMLDFYCRVLGFEQTDRGKLNERPAEIVFLSQAPYEHHQLALVPTRAAGGESDNLAHLAFRTDDLASLRELIGALQAENVDLRPVSHGNTWSVYLQDPEGNGLELFCDTPWHVRQPAGIPWDLELSDDALLAWTERTFSGEPGFVPRERYYPRSGAATTSS